MSLWRYLLAPYWAAELATGSKAFSDNPLIGSERLNRLGLHAARVKLADALAASRRRRLADLVTPEERADFDRDGFVLKRDFLSTAGFAALRDQIFGHAAPARETIQGDTITRRIALDPSYLKAVPAARDLLADRRFRGLIRYVGSHDAEPLVYVQTILPHRFEAPADPQTALHADTFHATAKAWLFLTDVAEEDGPFTYVPGSHRNDAARIAWERERSLRATRQETEGGLDRLSSRGSLRIEPHELASLGLPPPKRFAVPANTLIVADTHGFHARGQAAHAATRVEIWAYQRRNPFLPWTGLDPLGLPGVAERRIPFYWRASDWLKPWLGQNWRDVGVMKPAD
jgi:hypothetical protein